MGRYEFIKVEDYFNGYKGWSPIGNVTNTQPIYNSDEELVFKFINNEGTECVLTMRFPCPDALRLRFNPGKSGVEAFPPTNSRSIVMDTFDELSDTLPKVKIEELDISGPSWKFAILDAASNRKTMMVEVQLKPYRMTVYKYLPTGTCIPVQTDADAGIYYQKREITGSAPPVTEYSIIQAKCKPSTARYIGFGEKGGDTLYKNGCQLTYFNFDNMQYSVIYDSGPLNPAEPLYHSNPFFMEFNGQPGCDCVYGVFIDNASETFIDVGHISPDTYLFGSMYDDLDYYVFIGDDARTVASTYSLFVGKTLLKPRYTLGYHQGCYGYDTEEKLHAAVDGYRSSGIPIDGLHVDVDIQKNYCTFTMDTDMYNGKPKFSADTFHILKKDKGIKCSTNITPVISYLNDWYDTFNSGTENGFFVCTAPGQFYNGGVYYGNDYGTLGHYPDLGRKDVRIWWGNQYRMLFERGLEMVWQDMTTPAIPDIFQVGDCYIKGPDGTMYKIGNTISSDWRSFPMAMEITDNFQKKYNGQVVFRSNGVTESAPVGRIRNLYSYNLHKATYHGLNNIWYINEYTFTAISGVTPADSMSIISRLQTAKVLKNAGTGTQKYTVVNCNLEAKIPGNFPFRDQVKAVLEQSQSLAQQRKNKRNFIIGRGGFTGMHRYAGLWTGDNASTWDFLKINIAQALALGISGQSMSGEDIGGFEPTYTNGVANKWADPELIIRWTVMGAFLPWFRNHYNGKPGKKEFQEPFKFLPAFEDPANHVPWQHGHLYKSTLPACRRYIQLRYQLLPLLYDAMFENMLTGIPMCRPMFLNELDASLFTDRLQYLNSQLFVGKDLLVAPVLEKQTEENPSGARNVYLPSGSIWYTFKNNKYPLDPPVNGGREVWFDCQIRNEWGTQDPDNDPHLDFLAAIYVRSGAIIPATNVEAWVGQLSENPVTVNIYPGASGMHTMYSDDGVSRSSAPVFPVTEGGDPEAAGEYRQTEIKHYYPEWKKRTITLSWLRNNYVPDEKFLYLAVLHDPGEQIAMPISQIRIAQVNSSGDYTAELQCIGAGGGEVADKLTASTVNAWYYNNSINISFLKIFFPADLNKVSNKDIDPEKALSIRLSVDYT
jgi:alpha-glucosidase (family GH31 glycosyl hydrolase)